jgi:hypothetical protein
VPYQFRKTTLTTTSPMASNEVTPDSRRAEVPSVHHGKSEMMNPQHSFASWFKNGVFVWFDEERNLCPPSSHRLTRWVPFSSLAWIRPP